MKLSRNHFIGSLGAAALVAGIAAPVTHAGHEEYGVRCALALTQHRANAAQICASAAAAHQQTGVTPSVTVVQPSSFAWGDAGIGAAAAVGVLSLGAGGLIIAKHFPRTRSEDLTEVNHA